MPVRGADADGRDDVGGPRGSTIGDLDGGVTQRLTRRGRIAAAVLLALSACLLLVILLRSWGPVSAALAIIATGTVIVGGMLAIRARHWSMIRSTALPAAGPMATIGPTRPLSPVRTGAPVRRRLGAIVVPIRVDGGGQPGGGAIVVYARTDSLALLDADQVRCFAINGNGVEPVLTVDDPESSISGRFTLLRVSDGAVFLGTTRLTDTW